MCMSVCAWKEDLMNVQGVLQVGKSDYKQIGYFGGGGVPLNVRTMQAYNQPVQL